MKNVKMMLLSLALFAVVGGALAFKAKFGVNFCITSVGVTADNTGLNCPIRVASTTTYNPQVPFVATTTYDRNNCQSAGLKCTTTSTRLIPD